MADSNIPRVFDVQVQGHFNDLCKVLCAGNERLSLDGFRQYLDDAMPEHPLITDSYEKGVGIVLEDLFEAGGFEFGQDRWGDFIVSRTGN